MPPPPPTYIAMAKEKVMFALNSWRDAAAPASNSATPVTGPKGGGGAAASPTPPAAIAAAGGGSKGISNNANASAALVGTPGNKNARARNGSNAVGKNNAHHNSVAQHETVDYLVHVEVPPSISVEAVFFELQTQPTPLQTVEVGYSQTIVPATTAATNGGHVDHASNGSAREHSSSHSGKKIISPFQTPALYAAAKSGGAGDDDGDDDGLLLPPPSMALPEAAITKPNAAGTIGSPLPPPLPPAAAAATAANAGGAAHGAAAASAAASGVVMRPYKDDVYYHIYLIYAEKEEAEAVARFVARRWGHPAGSLSPTAQPQPQPQPQPDAAESGNTTASSNNNNNNSSHAGGGNGGGNGKGGARGKVQKEKKDGRKDEAGGHTSPAAAREEEPPTAAKATVTTRSRLQRNASLVLKGLPNLYRSELIVAEIMKDYNSARHGPGAAASRAGGVRSPSSTFTLSSAATGTAIPLHGHNSHNNADGGHKAYFRHKPSYARLHRGERGAFKNVVFVKYKNREEAEDSKLRLEHLRTGNRLLRVEYKKKVPAAGRAGATAADDAEDAARTEEMLHQLVRDLRTSAEHEGFRYAKGDLSREELKIVKQLCQSYGLSFELGETAVVVRRQLGAAHQTHPTPGSGPARVGSPSPSLRPQPTPTWAPKTPAAFASTNYKSIKHWRDVRTQTNEKHSLGIVRPLGPEDVAPFLPGRGRPI